MRRSSRGFPNRRRRCVGLICRIGIFRRCWRSVSVRTFFVRAEIILKKFCFKVCRGTPQAGGGEYTAFRTGKEGNDRMDYTEMLTDNRFSVIAALPRNDLALAEAALEGGAQAVKVHCNVWHRASGNMFGTFAENRTFLRELIALCGDVPVGLVPGGEDAYINEEERLELEEMGLSFFSSYAQYVPCHMMESTRLSSMIAIGTDYTQNTLDVVRASAIDVLECSIQPGENYGTSMNYADILRYSDIAAKTAKPCVVPTQRRIRPEEVRHLAAAGCKAIMIGAVVMGGARPEDVKRATAAFRAAADAV